MQPAKQLSFIYFLFLFIFILFIFFIRKKNHSVFL